MIKEKWSIALSKSITRCDTLWVSDSGRYCLTDGTHPTKVEWDLEDYILDTAALAGPILVSDSTFPVQIPKFKGRTVGQTGQAAKALQAYFLEKGIIAEPFKLALP